jgi:hypothetical protein
MRNFRKIVLVALAASLAAFGISNEALAVENQCAWSQSQDGTGGYIGTWDCGTCSASYIWRPGDAGWTSAGSDCG